MCYQIAFALLQSIHYLDILPVCCDASSVSSHQQEINRFEMFIVTIHNPRYNNMRQIESWQATIFRFNGSTRQREGMLCHTCHTIPLHTVFRFHFIHNVANLMQKSNRCTFSDEKYEAILSGYGKVEIQSSFMRKTERN